MTRVRLRGTMVAAAVWAAAPSGCGPAVADDASGGASESGDDTGNDEGSSSGASETTVASASASATTASTTASETSGSTSTSTSGSTGPMPDPDYLRECQPGDFVCEGWECEDTTLEGLYDGECYALCSTDTPGALDDECTEPERPYCSEVPAPGGGDFDCNAWETICLATPADECL